MASNRELLERGVGVLATFALLRTASKITLGITFPGTAAAVATVAAASICDRGESGGICAISRAANYPGNTAGTLLVGGGEKLVAMAQGGGLPALSR